MKGKKTDPIFISLFIQESVQQGAETPAEIVQRAKDLICQIDTEIKAIEGKKIVRSKLLDVISSFEKTVKNKAEEAKLLPLFTLEDPAMCEVVCKMVKGRGALAVGEMKLGQDARFAIKQLLEREVLARDTATDYIVSGERFDEYMKFVLHED